jgi:hypothetical protein
MKINLLTADILRILEAKKAARRRLIARAKRQARKELLASLGLTEVRGNLGGRYLE